MDSMAGALAKIFQLRSFLHSDSIPCKIMKGLYLGSVAASRNKILLKNLNITHILTASTSIDPSFPNDFVYKVIRVLDREYVDISKYFEECFEFIDEAMRDGGSVLVHCYQGRSRSVTIVAAYLMKNYHMSYGEAMQHVRDIRPEAAPNSGFTRQLQDLEKTLPGFAQQSEHLEKTLSASHI